MSENWKISSEGRWAGAWERGQGPEGGREMEDGTVGRKAGDPELDRVVGFDSRVWREGGNGGSCMRKAACRPRCLMAQHYCLPACLLPCLLP